MEPPVSAAVIPLTRLRKGRSAIVTSIEGESPHERGKLVALGIIPGTVLKLLQRFPSYVIQVGYTQLALDKQTAASIMVQQEIGVAAANKAE